MGNRRPTEGDETGAAPASLGEDARAALGDVVLRREPVVAERSRTVGGGDVALDGCVHAAVYGTPVETERPTAAAPTVGAASTPRATVVGRSCDPLAWLELATPVTSELLPGWTRSHRGTGTDGRGVRTDGRGSRRCDDTRQLRGGTSWASFSSISPARALTAP